MTPNIFASLSLAAIQTFIVVASEQNFSQAAKLLHITPSAVSHRIKLLEQQLNVRLFNRFSKGVTLTNAGKTLQQYVTQGMNLIHQGIQTSQFVSQREKLVIAVIPSLANDWLIPKLTAFYQAFTNIELEIIALDPLADFSSSRYDAHIHFGSGRYPGLVSQFLFKEKVYPVCHPSLYQSIANRPLSDVLQEYNLLLYRAGLEDEPGATNLAGWLRCFDIPPFTEIKQVWFSHVSMALTAAKQRQGIALGWHQIVKPAIEAGELIRITDYEIDTEFNYYFVATKKSWQREVVQQFYYWLAGQPPMKS